MDTMRFPFESVGVHWSSRFEMNTMRFPLESIGVEDFKCMLVIWWSWWGSYQKKTSSKHHLNVFYWMLEEHKTAEHIQFESHVYKLET